MSVNMKILNNATTLHWAMQEEENIKTKSELIPESQGWLNIKKKKKINDIHYLNRLRKNT